MRLSPESPTILVGLFSLRYKRNETHKVLEELAKVIGRAWAREWLDSLRERDSAICQSNKSKSPTQDSAAKGRADSTHRKALSVTARKGFVVLTFLDQIKTSLPCVEIDSALTVLMYEDKVPSRYTGMSALSVVKPQRWTAADRILAFPRSSPKLSTRDFEG
jgi:hypothetical protein